MEIRSAKAGTSFIRGRPGASVQIDAPWHDSRGMNNDRGCYHYAYNGKRGWKVVQSVLVPFCLAWCRFIFGDYRLICERYDPM